MSESRNKARFAQFSRAFLEARLSLGAPMSSPLARPRPGEPRYFVKRSPGGVSPAKMMSREEAAEMMMRTEFSAFSRGVETDASASATPEKRPESPRATRAADTDKVAARLVAAANARAEDAERRAFETEERAAARVADAEHDARQMADALGDAQRVIAELEHHVAETAMRRDDREHAASSNDDEHHDAERASAVAEANRRRLQAELEGDELRAKLEDAEKALTATREAARRALEAREKDARAKEQVLEAKLRDTESAFARERASRVRAEEVSREHERRRIRAIERLLKRTARRDEPSALRAALLESNAEAEETRDGDASSSFVSLTSAEEELVAIEGEHARELERLRGEVVAAKAETAKSVARAEASDALVRKTRREGEQIKSENEHLYRVLDRSNASLGQKGTSVVLRALKSLDAIEKRSVATYRVATRALDVARRACDAAEDVASSEMTTPNIEAIETGVEQNWVVSRDVLSEAWSVAGETRSRLERVRDEAKKIGAQLQRATTREANARVRADVIRRSREFARLSFTETYPRLGLDASDRGSGPRGSTQTEAGTHFSEHKKKSDDSQTPLRLTRRPMRVGSPTSRRGDRRGRSASPGAPPARPASEARGRSPERSPGRSPGRSPENGNLGDAATRRLTSRTPSPRPRTASPLRSSLSRSPSTRISSRSPGARRRVTFGEVTTSVFSPARGENTRPRSAPTFLTDTMRSSRAEKNAAAATSRVGAYIRGETVSVVSATEEKKELARRAAVAAAARANAEARAKASNPRSRTAPRPWHSEPKAFGSTARRRPSSARSDRKAAAGTGERSRRSPTKTFSPSPSARQSGSSPFSAKNVYSGSTRGRDVVHSSPAKRLASASPSRDKSPHPPPRDAVMASQRSPSASPPPPVRRGTETPSSRGR